MLYNMIEIILRVLNIVAEGAELQTNIKESNVSDKACVQL